MSILKLVPKVRVRWFALLPLVGLLALTGCPDKIGPLTSVHGQVTVDNTPLTGGGTVQFLPLATKEGVNLEITGMVGSDGSFTMTTNGRSGAPAGKYKVVVTPGGDGPEPDPNQPLVVTPNPTPVAAAARKFNAKFESPEQTTLVIEVPSSDYTLKLTK